MAGVKPSVNLFALLDRSDPGEKRLSDIDAAAKKTATTPAADAYYPSAAREHIIKQNQLEKKAKAKKRAADRAKRAAGASGADAKTNKVVQANYGGANRGGYNKTVGSSQKQQPAGTSGGPKPNNNGESRLQQQPSNNMAVKKVPAVEGPKAPPAAVQAPPPMPPSLEDVSEFPSLK